MASFRIYFLFPIFVALLVPFFAGIAILLKCFAGLLTKAYLEGALLLAVIGYVLLFVFLMIRQVFWVEKIMEKTGLSVEELDALPRAQQKEIIEKFGNA